MMKKVRLQKYLAEKGIDSRRNCEKLIAQGKIRVNHLIVATLGTRIDPAKDLVEFNHQIIYPNRKKKQLYIVMNKPKGYLCTYRDPFGRPTIYDLLKDIKTRINYAGRLDLNSEGLLLLTNDGELIYQLTHPSKELKKVYRVKIGGVPGDPELQRLEQGIPLSPHFITSPCKVTIIKKNPLSTILEITIREGKKRQIRRMFSSIGFSVLRLKRIKMGDISLNSLKPGQYRFLKKQEIERLKNKIDVGKMKG